MHPVMQNETEPGRGDCVAACVASVLEIPLAEVPNFRLASAPWTALQEWLAGRNLFAIKVVADRMLFHPMPMTFCILTGRSPRRDIGHAVVGQQTECDWHVVHDPHPDRSGLKGEPEWVIFFGVLQPERAQRVCRLSSVQAQ
jgi:hypothetical protein